MYKDEKLTKEYLTDLLYIIANTYELPFDPVSGTPVVYAAIPGEHRFRPSPVGILCMMMKT